MAFFPSKIRKFGQQKWNIKWKNKKGNAQNCNNSKMNEHFPSCEVVFMDSRKGLSLSMIKMFKTSVYFSKNSLTLKMANFA